MLNKYMCGECELEWRGKKQTRKERLKIRQEDGGRDGYKSNLDVAVNMTYGWIDW